MFVFTFRALVQLQKVCNKSNEVNYLKEKPKSADI